jgi:D-alanyl-D-alanine carboxypeptidase
MTPDDLGWGKPCPTGRITTFTAGGISLTAHEAAAPIFAAFIEHIVGRGYPVAGAVKDDWGYNCRQIAGSGSWSWHAWGLAIDLNALKNPMGPSLVTDMPSWIDDVAGRYGLFWGGNFNRRKDAMHFELHLTPAEAAEMRESLEKEADFVEKATFFAWLNEWATTGSGKAAIRQAATTRPAKSEISADSVTSGVNDLQDKMNQVLALLQPPPSA